MGSAILLTPGEPELVDGSLRQIDAIARAVCRGEEWEDVRQEAVLRLLRGPGPAGPAQVWRAVRDVAAERCRRRRRRRALLPRVVVDLDRCPAPLPVPDLDGVLARRAVEMLAPDERALLVARYDAGKAPLSLAAELGCCPRTVARRERRAMAKLRRLLRRSFVDHPVVTDLGVMIR